MFSQLSKTDKTGKVAQIFSYIKIYSNTKKKKTLAKAFVSDCIPMQLTKFSNLVILEQENNINASNAV